MGLCEGLLACEGKLSHLGLDKARARSTISDAKGLSIRNLKIIDSTAIRLFSDLLRGIGRNRLDGAPEKSGIKVHAMMDAFSG